MTNENILIEMFKRIQVLEKKVEDLENNKEVRMEGSKAIVSYNSETVSRVQARDYIIEQLRLYNPSFNIIKGNRAEGSGIVIEEKSTGLSYKMKVYHSNNHKEDRLFGWHKVHESHLEQNKYDFFIFSIFWEKEFYTFSFSFDEMCNMIAHKRKNNNGYYHFYFEKYGLGYYETRDKDDEKYGTSVISHLDNWKVSGEKLVNQKVKAFQIITDQLRVQQEIVEQKSQEKIINIDHELYPDSSEKVSLYICDHPTEENWKPKEEISNIKNVLLDISVPKEYSLNYVLEVVDNIHVQLGGLVEVLYTVTVNPNTPKEIKIFVTTK